MRKRVRAIDANWHQLCTVYFAEQLCYREALLQLVIPLWLPGTDPGSCLWDTEGELLYKHRPIIGPKDKRYTSTVAA